jgi:hypothetical protein
VCGFVLNPGIPTSRIFPFTLIPKIPRLLPDPHKPINEFIPKRLSIPDKTMSDPSIDPSLARPQTQNDQTHSVPSSNIFSTAYDDGPDPATYQMAALQGATTTVPTDDNNNATTPEGKRGSKSKKSGPLVRKRSGWNSFYKEQFALYHANNPPKSKQNAREREGFSTYASELWKKVSPEEKEMYRLRAEQDDTLAVSRPVEKLRRKRTQLLETLGRAVAELEVEFGVESLVLWAEKEIPPIEPDGTAMPMTEGEEYGIVGSTTGSGYIELLTTHNLGPVDFTSFIQQNQPPPEPIDPNLPVTEVKKRGRSIDRNMSILSEDLDPSGLLNKKTKSNISRDYHDAEFRRLLLTLLNDTFPPQNHKNRLPRGFFGSYLDKLGLELVGLPEKPVEIGEGGKIGGWSADALRRNLEALRANRVFIRKIDDGTIPGAEMHAAPKEEELDMLVDQVEEAGVQVEEAARILTEGVEHRRGRRAGAK